MNSGHKGVTPVITYNSGLPSQVIINSYNQSYRQIANTSKRIRKNLEDALRELELGGRSRRLAFGPDFEVSDSYRPDGRFFSKKKLPDNIPEMAVAVLVDQSGSMLGPRAEAAKTMAILIDDFCRGLDIPVLVAGHHVLVRGKCNYNIYTDFDRVGDKSKYNLAKVNTTGGCNRDGFAIAITANLLEKRPEPIKLMFIISDGQPNDNGYGGNAAAEDIQSILSTYKRKGVLTFAAAIGDDKDKIQKIYGDGFLDIKDLSVLPKTIVRIVKKQIIENMR